MLWHKGCKSLWAIIYFPISKCKYMLGFSQVLFRLFADKPNKPVPTDIQTALEPVHEQNLTEGVEFIDDFERLDEQPDSETK